MPPENAVPTRYSRRRPRGARRHGTSNASAIAPTTQMESASMAANARAASSAAAGTDSRRDLEAKPKRVRILGEPRRETRGDHETMRVERAEARTGSKLEDVRVARCARRNAAVHEPGEPAGDGSAADNDSGTAEKRWGKAPTTTGSSLASRQER